MSFHNTLLTARGPSQKNRAVIKLNLRVSGLNALNRSSKAAPVYGLNDYICSRGHRMSASTPQSARVGGSWKLGCFMFVSEQTLTDPADVEP